MSDEVDDYSPAHKRARYDFETTVSNEKFTQFIPAEKEGFYSVGRLDCKSDCSSDDDTIFSENNVGVNISCASLSPTTREKQLSVLESALTKETLDKLSTDEWNGMLLVKNPNVTPTDKYNFFDLLSDEVVLHIFKNLSKSSLTEVALVCRRFYQLTLDESLWTKIDSANKRLKPGQLGTILSRQVLVLRLSRSEIPSNPILNNCKAFSSGFESRLMYLDLGMAQISTDSLQILLSKCKRLKKISLEHIQVDNYVLKALSQNSEIEVINFAMCAGIEEEGLECLLKNCLKIKELNIAWTYLTKNCIQFICKNLAASLLRLNFSGCRKSLLDENVADLVASCPRLRELDLSDCTQITGNTVKHILMLEELSFVALSRCYLIPHQALFQLKKLENLSYLDIHGGHIDGEELNLVKIELGNGVQINKFKFSSVARPTVGVKRSSIWNIRVRD